MPVTLVLDPACGFTSLRKALTDAGWRMLSASEQPILPGEPEYAMFERAAGEHLHYSFNPVCRLRLVETPPELDVPSLAALPALGVEPVADWLLSGDERTQLRGILAARQMSDAGLLARVEALRNHPRASIARAAAEAVDVIRTRLAASGSVARPAPADVSSSDTLAQVQALASIEILKQELAPLLRALGQDADGQLSGRLRPRPEDYARAFLPEFAAAARAAYEKAWASAPRIAPADPASQLQMHIAPAGMLADDNALSWHFPGGYRSIAPLLQPTRVWVAWKLIPPGQTAGMAYDGLVWLDDHWAWFPKPYRVLAKLVQ